MAPWSFMTRNTIIASIMYCFIGYGSTLRVDVTPNAYNKLLTKELNISCISDGPGQWSRSVVTLQLMKMGHKPIAVYSINGLAEGPNMKENMEVEGQLGKQARRNYIRLTVNDPGIEDTGTYVCVMFYLDEMFHMKEMKASANVTVANEDTTAVMKYLMDKVSDLETSLSEQVNVISGQNDTIRNLEEQLEKQKDQLEKQLEKQKDQLEKQLEKQKDHMEEQLEKQKDHMEEHEFFASAFSATIGDSGALSKGQVLVFPEVAVNFGNDYSKDTGVYTAPVDGLYSFTLFASFSAVIQKKLLHIDLVSKDSREVTLVLDSDDTETQSSVSAILRLKANETVKCKVSDVSHNDIEIYRYWVSGFTGHLIKALKTP